MAMVKLFGAFGDRAGWSERRIEAATLGALRRALLTDSPMLADRLEHGSTLVIVNHALLPASARSDDLALAADDEVAFGPPVSGG